MTRLGYIFIIVFIPLLINGQSDLRIGEWRAFLPYEKGNTVTQSETRIYFGADNALLIINKEDQSIDFFSKVEGLTDVGLRIIKYHDSQDALIIAYENSNLDIVYEDQTVNLNNIQTNPVIIGSRRILDIFVDNGNTAYLSCSFGLVELNVETKKFGVTVFTDSPVNAFTKYGGQFYMATDNGLYRFDPTSNLLVDDFNNWTKLGPESDLPSSYSAQAVAVYEGKLYAGIDGDLYQNDAGFFLLFSRENYEIRFISVEGSRLMAGFRCFNQGGECIGKIFFFDENGFLGESGFDCTARPNYILEDENGQLWYADEFPDFRTSANPAATCDRLRFNTPYSEKVSEMAVQDDILYVAAGGPTSSFGFNFSQDGFFVYNEGQWTNYNKFNFDPLQEQDPRDYHRILPHPDGERVFVGTFGFGLIEYDFENFSFYDQDNSGLQGAVGDGARELITGLAFDEEKNLWISNFRAPNPVVIRKNDGTWFAIDPSCAATDELTELVIDEKGYKWFVSESNTSGVLVYDDNGTIDDTNDDRCKLFADNNSALPTNDVYTIALDLDGDIWVGTAEGPVIFDGAADIFDGNHEGFRIKIEQDDLISFLLSEEEILTIAIDGGNRKWMGTRNGVFVQSANGEVQVANYNVSNSPMLSNVIRDIAINPKNGEVFIGTDAGIISLRSDAIEGRNIHSPNVYAFPNPVRENYDGTIAIRGLARDAIVKITDISGQLIYETRALGGQATWDGNSFDGRRASTGVYLVFSTAEGNGFTKPDALVTKILLVN